MAKKTLIKKYYRRKTRWSPNISEFFSASGSIEPETTFHLDSTIATNPVQSTLGVSQIYTVKNFEINFEFEETTSVANFEHLAAYIMFVPQGMVVTNDYNTEHPEYIMAYQFYGSPTQNQNTTQLGTRRIKSRMARKLNTGDKVILFIKGINYAENPAGFRIRGLVRWWTKAN